MVKRRKRMNDLDILLCPITELLGTQAWKQDGYLNWPGKPWWLQGMSVAIQRADVRAWLRGQVLSEQFADKLITAARMGGWRVVYDKLYNNRPQQIIRRDNAVQ